AASTATEAAAPRLAARAVGIAGLNASAGAVGAGTHLAFAIARLLTAHPVHAKSASALRPERARSTVLAPRIDARAALVAARFCLGELRVLAQRTRRRLCRRAVCASLAHAERRAAIGDQALRICRALGAPRAGHRHAGGVVDGHNVAAAA